MTTWVLVILLLYPDDKLVALDMGPSAVYRTAAACDLERRRAEAQLGSTLSVAVPMIACLEHTGA